MVAWCAHDQVSGPCQWACAPLSNNMGQRGPRPRAWPGVTLDAHVPCAAPQRSIWHAAAPANLRASLPRRLDLGVGGLVRRAL